MTVWVVIDHYSDYGQSADSVNAVFASQVLADGYALALNVEHENDEYHDYEVESWDVLDSVPERIEEDRRSLIITPWTTSPNN